VFFEAVAPLIDSAENDNDNDNDNERRGQSEGRI
jgi:hypothetical protein